MAIKLLGLTKSKTKEGTSKTLKDFSEQEVLSAFQEEVAVLSKSKVVLKSVSGSNLLHSSTTAIMYKGNYLSGANFRIIEATKY
jgi:hypothetical protein